MAFYTQAMLCIILQNVCIVASSYKTKLQDVMYIQPSNAKYYTVGHIAQSWSLILGITLQDIVQSPSSAKYYFGKFCIVQNNKLSNVIQSLLMLSNTLQVILYSYFLATSTLLDVWYSNFVSINTPQKMLSSNIIGTKRCSMLVQPFSSSYII